MSLPVVRVAGLVDDDRAREDEHGVLVVLDLDAVGVAEREPALRDRRDDAVAATEGVFVVEEIAARLEIVGPRDVDAEAVME